MSIESFVRKYPADERFAEEISIDHDMFYFSPADFMADIYISEGSEGLWDATDRYFTAKNKGEEIVAEFALDEIYLNHHAVLMGVTIKTIRDILNSGEFDEVLFNGRLESALNATGESPQLISDPRVGKIPESRMEEMRRVLENDSTYADFLDTKFCVLPRRLRQYLERDKFRQYLPRLLPDYILRTSLLISSQKNRTT